MEVMDLLEIGATPDPDGANLPIGFVAVPSRGGFE